MLTIELTVHFDPGTPERPRGYIGHPYWPEVERLINITKKSGMNRCKTTDNARKALEEYLKSIKMTPKQFAALEVAAARPFYRAGVKNDGLIIIPVLHIESMLVATAHTVRAASRACQPEQVRTRIQASAWITNKEKEDGIFRRFVIPNTGTGAKLSNQRSLRRNAYIADFDASGTLTIDPELVKPTVLHTMLCLGGRDEGVGAARKMGFGRFVVTRWKVQG